MSETMPRRQALKTLSLLGVSAALAPGVLSACSSSGSGGGAGPSGAPTGGGTKDISFWWNPSVESGNEMVQWMNGVVSDFEAANPGAHVDTATQPPEQLVGNFRAACQARSGPSLQFEYSGPNTMQFVWTDCVAPLDDLVSGDFSHVIPPVALKLYEYQGKTWALPWYNAPVVLVYNKALFKQAGLDPEHPPTTIDELEVAASALKKSGVVPWGYGLKGLTGIGNFSNLFNMQELNDPNEMLSVVIGDKPYTDAKYSGWLTWVKEMIGAGIFNDDVTSLGYGDSQNMFMAKKSAIGICSSLPVFQEALGDDLGLFTPPARGKGGLAGKITFNSHPLFIPSFAANKELAAKLLSFLHTQKNLNGMYSTSGFFPADDRFDSSVITKPTDKQLFEFTNKQSSLSYQNYWPSQMDRENLFIAVQALFAGERTPTQAAGDVQQRLDAWRKASQADLKNFKDWSGK